MRCDNFLPSLYIVLPCFNEEVLIESSAHTVKEELKRLIELSEISPKSRILFVDDGSFDRTWALIENLHKADPTFEGISLSKNRGHQIAIYAGMMSALERGADIAVTIDADLQQDIRALLKFIEEYKSGADVVYGIRNSRDTDSFLKKSTATAYYKLMRFLGCDIVEQSADYRLLSKKALLALSQYKEYALFIRGIVPDMGFKSSKVYFDVKERTQGSSKYTLKKMLTLALDGATSFSVRPIRIMVAVGILISLISIIMMISVVIDYLMGNTVSGYSTVLISIWLLGGIQILFISIIGEYISRTYLESKSRPRYFISDSLGDESNNKAQMADSKRERSAVNAHKSEND